MSHGPIDEPPRGRSGGSSDERRARGEPEDAGPSAATYAGLGLQFLAAILLFLYVGRWLDARLGTSPWLLIAGVLVGAGAAFFSLYRKLMKEQAREDARRAARKAGRPAP
jgi:ATP synthase protein I